MGTVEVRVRADGFRLDPQAHLQPQQVDFFAQAGQTVRQFCFVRYPVAQTGGIIVAALEPAVVQHKEVDVGLFGGSSQFQQLLFVKVEVAGFPAVDEHRAGRGHILPLGRQQPGTDGIVEPAAHLAQTLAGVDHGRFRCGKAFPGGQRPVEVIRVDAHHQPLARIGTLGLDEEVAAVHQRKAPCIAVCFGGVGAAESHCRVVCVAGDAPHTADALDAAAECGALRGALSRPCAVEGDEFQRIRCKIEGQ